MAEVAIAGGYVPDRDAAKPWSYRAKAIRAVMDAAGGEAAERVHAAIRALPYGAFADEPQVNILGT